MGMKRKAISALTAAIILFAGTISGTVLYFENVIANQNSQITALNSQLANLGTENSNLAAQAANQTAEIQSLNSNLTDLATEKADLNSQISNLTAQTATLSADKASMSAQITNLTAQVANLTSAYITTDLSVNEIPNNEPLYALFPTMAPDIPYDSLQINGSVTNAGRVKATNMGLNVTAYGSDGTLEINMTVPLNEGVVYGTDNATNNMIQSIDPRTTVNDGGFNVRLGNLGPTGLSDLEVGQTVEVSITIYHEGTATDWTVTPIWTNSP